MRIKREIQNFYEKTERDRKIMKTFLRYKSPVVMKSKTNCLNFRDVACTLINISAISTFLNILSSTSGGSDSSILNFFKLEI